MSKQISRHAFLKTASRLCATYTSREKLSAQIQNHLPVATKVTGTLVRAGKAVYEKIVSWVNEVVPAADAEAQHTELCAFAEIEGAALNAAGNVQPAKVEKSRKTCPAVTSVTGTVTTVQHTCVPSAYRT